MSRRLRFVLAAAAVSIGAGALAHSLVAQSASATMAVSVTVVRSCTVATPDSLAPGPTSAPQAVLSLVDAPVRIRCGRAAASLQSPGAAPAAAAQAAASIQTSKSQTGLVVSVDF